MNGAHALLATLGANGVTTCFANPGTSEMHFVAALDDYPEMRGVLCLFEGVATGAADGYARVTGRPAATLLHLGPGLANGWANLHNARRAQCRSSTSSAITRRITRIRCATPERHRRRRVSPRRLARAPAPAPTTSRVTRLMQSVPPTDHRADRHTRPPADVSWNELSSTPDAWPLAHRATSRPARRGAPLADPRALADEAVRALRGGDGPQRRATRTGPASGRARRRPRLIMETFPTIMDHGAGPPVPSG